jgi:acyl-CoA reductase-like NAD-dependent aldehyde dehydrogenase
MKIWSVNPATEEKIQAYETTSMAGIREKVENSRKAFYEWKTTDVAEREELLRSLAKNLLRGKKEYSNLITTEMGKPIRESVAEIEKCGVLCEYYAENFREFLKNEIVKTEAKKSYVTFQPLGVVACIMPWNFPFWQVLRFAVPAITAGNTVILKHSSVCPGSALTLSKVMEESGFPKGVFQVVIGPASVGEALIKSEIDAVSVTGSVETGKRVASLAAERMKKFVLELGGNDPFIVLEDADLRSAVEGAVKGRIVNSGQSCIAAKRFIVVSEVSEEFTDMLVEAVSDLATGDPSLPETNVGPLVREAARERLEKQVLSSVRMGARILIGGRRPERKGYFYMPTVLSKITQDMPVASQETFGPVAPIIVVKDEEAAINIANKSELGLGASVWTKDLKRGERVVDRIEAGITYVNGAVHSDPRMPFGGVKKSGIGRELSHYGLKEFVNIKSIKIFR